MKGGRHLAKSTSLVLFPFLRRASPVYFVRGSNVDAEGYMDISIVLEGVEGEGERGREGRERDSMKCTHPPPCLLHMVFSHDRVVHGPIGEWLWRVSSCCCPIWKDNLSQADRGSRPSFPTTPISTPSLTLTSYFVLCSKLSPRIFAILGYPMIGLLDASCALPTRHCRRSRR